MLASIPAATLLGVTGHPVQVEVHVGNGLPSLSIVGLPDASCREARDRVRAAVLSSDIAWPQRRITVNLAPSSLHKLGTGLDLALAVGVLVACGEVPAEAVGRWAFLGELGLDGTVRSVRGVVPLVAGMRHLVDGVVVAPSAVAQARVIPGVRVRCASSLSELVAALRVERPWPELPPTPVRDEPRPLDIADVRGQALGRRALEIAAAGGHHVLLSGPPGAGKTLLATRLPGLLPDLDDDAALEVTQIHSAAGAVPSSGLVRRPPFRAPHHTASAVALIGGGTVAMRPGEVSLAHASVSLCSLMQRAGIYTRISSDPTGQRLGVQRQEEECRAKCESLGWTVVELFEDDDRSAYSGKPRHGYLAMLDAVRSGTIDAVVSWAPDRLHRSPRELEDFIDLVESKGLAVETVLSGAWNLSTSDGRMAARVVGAVARAESERKGERLKAKARQLAKAGKVSGGGTRPFGWEDDRKTLRAAEAKRIREAAERVLAGDSLYRIATDWNEAGVTTTTGREWRTQTLRRTLTAARTAGHRELDGKMYPAEWSAPLTLDELHKVRAVLRDPGRLKRRSTRRYLLTGFTFCGLCEAKLVARPNEHHRRKYVCSSGPNFDGCGKIACVADELEALVVGAIHELIGAADIEQRLAPTASDPVERAEVEQIEERLDELAEMFAAGDIDRREWSTAREALATRLSALSSREAATVHERASTTDVRHLRTLKAEWEDLPIERRRAVVDLFVERIVIAPAVHGRNFFDPGRVDVEWKV